MVTAPYQFLSVCSGIEAFSVAVRDLDFVAAAFAEIEAFPSKVLTHHYPNVPNLGDMTAIDTAALGRVDWLVGGTPCQSFSVAGLRGGLNDERGNLTLEYVKLARRLQDGNGLRGFLWENVPGVLSSADNAFGCLLAGVVGHDDPLEPGPKPRIGRSNDFWKWIKPREQEPVYDEEGQETGEFTEAAEGYHRIKWPSVGMVAGPRARLAWRILDSRYFGVPQRRRRVYVVADFGDGPDPATVLFEPRGQGWGAAPGGEAREGVAGTIERCTGAVAHALRAKANLAHRDAGWGSASAVAIAMRGREGGATAELGDDQANALRAGDGGGSRSMALTGPQVRRLTPIECERLQGFPDNYTLIPGLSGWRDVGDDETTADLEAMGLTVKTTKKGKRRVNDPDGPRYRALGNSFTTETVNWIMSRVQASLRGEPMPDWQPMQLWRHGPWRPK